MTLGLIPLRPLDASLDGFRNDALFNVTTLMVSVLFVVVSGILLWAILVHRDGRRRASYDRGTDRRHLVFTAVITAVIFFGVDGTLLVDSYLDLDQVLWKFPSADEHPLTVEVWAQQWAWNIRYAGPDGEFGTPDDIVTLNQLRVPVGRPVLVELKAKDVMHAFYLPNFRVKQDAIPGAVTLAWFQATQPGRYEIACAQMCGFAHYKMRGELEVVSPAEFDSWQKEMAAEARRQYDAKDVAARWAWPWGTR